jgi:hypothetical protein
MLKTPALHVIISTGILFPDGKVGFLFFSVQTDAGAYPTSYPMATRDFISREVKLTYF